MAARLLLMTTEPKFIPDEAVEIRLEGSQAVMRVKMVDCVGYIVPDALGSVENGGPRMVHTPWSAEPVPFEEAAETAANLYVEYEGAAADTPMCLLSTGVTDDGGKPYIPSLELPCDAESPEQLSGCVYPSDSLIRMMSEVTGSVMLPPDHSQWFTDAEYTAGGTLQSVCFGGKTVTGEQLREILGMRSAAITVVSSYDEFEFTAAGVGGNTGMSLYAAERLARGGKTARQIIEYFFPGTSVKSIR